MRERAPAGAAFAHGGGRRRPHNRLVSFDRSRLPAGLTIAGLSATLLLVAPAGALASEGTVRGSATEIACGDGLDVVTADVVAAACERGDRSAPAYPDTDPIFVIQPVSGPEPVSPAPPAQFELSTPVPAPAATPVPGARAPAPPAAPARLRRVKAIVRLAGTLTARGAKIKLLSVRGAPRGAAIEVSCRGRGCPTAAATRTARSSGLRFAPFQRTLGAGTVITVAVRPAAAAIGKHTRFVIRRGAAPLRTDACLVPGTSAPTRCPRP